MKRINVLLCGAAGKMGREITRAINGVSDLELVGAADLVRVGEDAGLLAGIGPLGISVSDNLPDLLAQNKANVLIDFTSPLTVMDNIEQALQNRVAVVVGTTGLGDEEIGLIRQWVERHSTGAIIAPNFALGAVLMMKMVQLCARYFKTAEIIEMHHDEKLDAPSGTALQTARLIGESAGGTMEEKEKLEKIPGVLGGRVYGVPIHSVRLPGLVAHQEVLFGGTGQLLTLRHDAFTRDCFIPGLLMAIRKAPENKQFIYGIENLLDEI